MRGPDRAPPGVDAGPPTPDPPPTGAGADVVMDEAARRRARTVVRGVVPSLFLNGVDQSIVPVALLTIAGDIGGIELVAWVMSAYLVAAAVCTPVYGKLSDLYGRRRLMSIALAVSLVASVLCALATSMIALIAFRVLQGLGSGSVFALSQAAIADVVPGRERGRYQIYFAGVFMSAALAAPLLGGFLTHYLSWRAIFWLNVPLTLFALWAAHRALAVIPPRRHAHSIDWTGAALLTAGLSLVLIGLARVGQGAGWTEPSTLALYGAGLAVLVGWVLHSLNAREPIVPLELLRNRGIAACSTTMLFAYFGTVGVTVLLPLALQSLGGLTPDQVALRLLPLTVSVPIGGLLAGRVILRWPDYRLCSQIGFGSGALGLLALAFVPIQSPLVLLLLVILGLGLGANMPISMVAAQVVVGPQLVGMAAAMTSLFRLFGGAVGIAVLTSVLFLSLGVDRRAAPSAAGGDGAAMTTRATGAAGALAGAAPDSPRLRRAFTLAFVVAAGGSALGVVAAAGLPTVRRRRA